MFSNHYSHRDNSRQSMTRYEYFQTDSHYSFPDTMREDERFSYREALPSYKNSTLLNKQWSRSKAPPLGNRTLLSPAGKLDQSGQSGHRPKRINATPVLSNQREEKLARLTAISIENVAKSPKKPFYPDNTSSVLPQSPLHPNQSNELIKSLSEETKTTIALAQSAWVENDPERAKQIYSDFRDRIFQTVPFWNTTEILEKQALLYELEDNLKETLQICEEYLKLYPRINFPHYLLHLTLRFQMQLTKSSQSNNIFDDFSHTTDLQTFLEKNKIPKHYEISMQIKLIIALAKFAHSLSLFEKRDDYLRLLYDVNSKTQQSLLLSELENFSIEIGDVSFVQHFSDRITETNGEIIRTKTIKKSNRSKLPQSYVTLLYQEGSGQRSYAELKNDYQQVILEDVLANNMNVSKYLQYIHFLVRGGDIKESILDIEELLLSSFISDPKDVRELKLIYVQLLISNGEEEKAINQLKVFTTDESKHAPFLFEKAFLHLNPLSAFYDVEEAEKIYTHIKTRKIGEQYPQLSLLEYRIACLKRQNRKTAERSLQLLIKDLYGSIKVLMCRHPSHLPIHEKTRLLINDISKQHDEDFLQVADARKTLSLDETFVVAEKQYGETDRLTLYRQFIDPTGICMGNLHEKIAAFTPSQRICDLFKI